MTGVSVSRLKNESGFGLIELLIAMVILQVALLGIVAVFSSGAIAMGRASKLGTASVLADRQMEQYRYPRSVGIFVMPPSPEALIERLKGRGSEEANSLEVRIRNAEAEMARVREYDYQVVNDDLDRGLFELKAIRLAEHCRIRNSQS